MASVFALRAAGESEDKVTLRVRSGEELEIAILDPRAPDGSPRDVRLSGPAIRLFEGRFPDSVFTF
jgi:diaminopimelate epimerase